MKCLCVDGRAGGTVVDHVRLFRNRPENRWKYRVHEQILPALKTTGTEIRWTDIVIHHVGYQDPVFTRHKLEDFTWRPGRQQIRQLADAGLLGSAAFTRFCFAAWAGATEEELIDFAQDVASLCTFTIGQHTGVPVLTLLDAEGRAIKRFLWQSVESRVRRGGVLDNSEVLDGVPKLFTKCFDEHVRMRHSALPWRRLPLQYAAIEDPPYLEQKFASLMMALEFFAKNSLRERPGAMTQKQIDGLQLPGLLGHARRVLGWDIPDHYTARELYRLLRNAVMHGGELPTKDAAEFRHSFDMWMLFLARRILIRLGYTGKIHSPVNGFSGLSQVDDFSQSCNSFAPP